MSLTVQTAAKSSDLVQLATVKSRLGTADSEDAYLAELIDEISQSVADFVRRPLGRQTYVETRPGNGAAFLHLARTPLERVDTITFDGTAETDYSIDSKEASILYLQDGWSRTSALWGDIDYEVAPGNEKPNWVFTYTAGYLMPGQVSTTDNWAATTAYAVGDLFGPDVTTGLYFEVTTAGTSGGSAPTWPTAAGETVTDGSVVWTARAAQVLPKSIERAAWLGVQDAYFRDKQQARSDLTSRKSPSGASESYKASTTETESGLPRRVEKMLERWRLYG